MPVRFLLRSPAPAWIGILLAIAGAASLFGQDSSNGESQAEGIRWREERRAVEETFRAELTELANWCQTEGLAAEATSTLEWSRDRDVERQYLYLPGEAPWEPETGEGARGEWLDRLAQLRRQQAERIWELAERAVEAGAGGFAFQRIHEVLYYNPDHEQARRVLGHRRGEAGWQITLDRLRVRDATRPHPVMNWPAKTYRLVSSDNFEIASRASEEATVELAAALEKWHLAWRQVFFEFWNRPQTLQRWMEGRGQQRKTDRGFQIVFFADRDQYLSELGPRVPGIEVSTGYYNDGDQTSFFYASEDSAIRDTWRHEATHQWFAESIRTARRPFEDSHIWLSEGIAMYFESLVDLGDWVTLGGWESRRLQFARVRWLREDFRIPFDELTAMGRSQLQQREDIKKLYTQSAGMTHMLMNAEAGRFEQQLVQFLKLLYQGKLKPETFQKVMGTSPADLEKAYTAYLLPAPDQVARYLEQPESRTEIALLGVALETAGFTQIGRCRNLAWLDLSGSPLSDQPFAQFETLPQLRQLFLSRCTWSTSPFEGHGRTFPGLVELDLNGTSATDSDLDHLADWPALADLQLIQTQITDRGLEALARFPRLQQVDLRGTAVTADAIRKLLLQKPNLKIIYESNGED